MAGIYISGMEMPKEGCVEIQIFAEGIALKTGYTVRIKDKDYYQPTIGETPPMSVISVPDHGRLIDADAMIESVELDDLSTLSEVMHIKEVMHDVPTIIPGEEVER